MEPCLCGAEDCRACGGNAEAFECPFCGEWDADCDCEMGALRTVNAECAGEVEE